jgi:hypothetical protein
VWALKSLRERERERQRERERERETESSGAALRDGIAKRGPRRSSTTSAVNPVESRRADMENPK